MDDNTPLMEAMNARERIESLEAQCEWLQEQVRTMMAVVTMLAEAERYRIQKFADKKAG